MEINTLKKISYIFGGISAVLSIGLIILSVAIMPLFLVATEYLVACIATVIIGTVIGIILTYKEEFCLTGITYILTAIGAVICASLMGALPCLLYLILGILILCFNRKLNNKILIPVCILVLIPMILLLFSGISMDGDSGINLVYENNTIVDNYGYYGGDSFFKLTTNKSYDYLEAHIEYYDENNVIIYKDSLAWNANDVKPNQTYQIQSTYYQQKKPVKMIISIYKGLGDDESICNLTVDLKNSSVDDNKKNETSHPNVQTSNSKKVYAYKSDGTPMYSQSEVDRYMSNKYWDGADYHIQDNGYINFDEGGFDDKGNYKYEDDYY